MNKRYWKLAALAVALGLTCGQGTAPAQTSAGVQAPGLKKTDDDALAGYDKAIALKPLEASGYSDRAVFYIAHNQPDKALPDFDKLIELKPNDISYRIRQGQALRALQRTDDAIASFIKALEIAPNDGAALVELGITYRQTKSYDMAQERFNQALAGNPNNINAYLNRGILYFEQGRRTQTMKDFDTAIELQDKWDKETNPAARNPADKLTDSGLAQAYFYRSLIHARGLSVASPDAAKTVVSADATKTVQLDPAVARVYMNGIASRLDSTNAKYGVAALLAGAAAARPDDSQLLIALGDAQGAAFNSTGAIESYTRALKIEPNSLPALRGRAVAYGESAVPYNSTNWAAAVTDWKSYLARKTDDADGWQRLGLAQYNAGQSADGLATFRRVAAANKDGAYAHLMIGLGLAIAGDKNGATTEVQNYLAKATPAEVEKAKSNAGNATTHYPTNEAIKAIYDLIPEKKADDDGLGIFFL